MADNTHVPDPAQPGHDGGSGWGIRTPRDTANHDWDAPPAPLPPPLPALMHAPAPAMNVAPPPPLPPPLVPRASASTPFAPGALPRKPRNQMVVVGAGIVAVALIAGGFLFVTGKGPETVVPLSTPVPSTVAVVHAGPAQLTLESLTGGGPVQTVKLPGAPDEVLATPDRSKAFLLDTAHGDVVPVNLVSGVVGAPISVGKLPVAEEMSADGTTLYVTDNLGGTVIAISTATDKLAPARALTQGVAFYVPSPTTASALVGISTSAGLPGVVYFSNGATGAGSQISVGSNPAQSAFYSKDGKTVWIVEDGSDGQPGALIPLDVTTQKPGKPIKLGVAPNAYALTPNGDMAVFANQASNTLSIVDLLTRAVVATVPLPSLPADVAVDAKGTTAWVASSIAHSLVPVSLLSHKVGKAASLDNAPGDLTIPTAPGVAWVLFPSSNGSINFLSGVSGPLRRSIPVGNDPEPLIGTGSETSWVANATTSTVQRLNIAGESAGPPITVDRAPVDLQLTTDGSTLLVLSYGDGQHAGALTGISTATSALSKPLAVGPAPGPLTISPTSGIAYIASYVGRSITIVDVAAWKVDTTLKLPCGPTDMAITPEGNQLYVACADDGAIVGVSLSNNKLEGLVALPSVRRLVMAGDGSTLLVVGDNGLYNVNIDTDKIVKAVPETGNLVDIVETPDGNTLLAVDNSGAALVMINPVTLVTIKSLSLGTRPGEVALSPDGTHAYVLDTTEQKLFVVDVATWKVTTTINIAPNAIDIAVPLPVVVPPS
jgi:YVTN family beta-propeller protein